MLKHYAKGNTYMYLFILLFKAIYTEQKSQRQWRLNIQGGDLAV